jgi:hypothetical protein
MDVRERVQKVFDAERNEVQLDKFLADVRDSLTTSRSNYKRRHSVSRAGWRAGPRWHRVYGASMRRLCRLSCS